VWSTIEAVDYPQALTVQKKGSLEPFVRERLFISLYDSCKHRPQALEDARALTQTVISKLLPQVQNATLPREIIITTVGAVLKNFDHAAHVHYTAYHPSRPL
jgi:transcriptional regulator NrdR family protein